MSERDSLNVARTEKERAPWLLTLGTLAIFLAHIGTGTATHPQHVIHVILRAAYLLPIVASAIIYGLRGGLLAATGVGALTLLHIASAWHGRVMENANQLVMLIVYLVMGVACGTLIDRQRRKERELTMNALLGLAEALEIRDGYTREHSEAVSDLAQRLGRHFGLPKPVIENLRLAGLVHDIGKIGVPDDILLKPGSLTTAERASIERHPELAARILASLRGIDEVVDLVLLHHEYIDGSGYPRGLQGEAVGLPARILQVADVYSALTDKRPYKPAISREKALAILKELGESKLDASVVSGLEELIG